MLTKYILLHGLISSHKLSREEAKDKTSLNLPDNPWGKTASVDGAMAV